MHLGLARATYSPTSAISWPRCPCECSASTATAHILGKPMSSYPTRWVHRTFTSGETRVAPALSRRVLLPFQSEILTGPGHALLPAARAGRAERPPELPLPCRRAGQPPATDAGSTAGQAGALRQPGTASPRSPLAGRQYTGMMTPYATALRWKGLSTKTYLKFEDGRNQGSLAWDPE